MPGLYAEATLTLEQKNTALAVPLQAVNQTNDQTTVLLVDPNNTFRNGRCAWHPDRDRRRSPTGLQEGETVVVSDRSGLKSRQASQAARRSNWSNIRPGRPDR